MSRGQYVVETIGQADDFADADGLDVLTFCSAIVAASPLQCEPNGTQGVNALPVMAARDALRALDVMDQTGKQEE